MSSKYRLGWSVGLGFVLVAFATGTASASSTENAGKYADLRYAQLQDRSAAGFYTPQALKADGLRLEAIADVYRRLKNRPAASFYTPQALKAEGLRWEAMALAYRRDASPPDTVSRSTGLDWSDAGVGAAGGIGFALMGIGLALIARQRMNHGEGGSA